MITESTNYMQRVNGDVLVFIRYYLPGFKAGGALRSLANLIDLLGDEVNFHVVTSNRDLLDRAPYPRVASNCWVHVGKARVWYWDGSIAGMWALSKALRELRDASLYLNSFFDPHFSLMPLMLAKLGLLRGRVILGPRGEFSPGALDLKRIKKRMFLFAARGLGIFRWMEWHASSEHERADIISVFRAVELYERTHVARDLTVINKSNLVSPANNRDVVFMARISRKKNLDFALRVLARCDEYVDFHIYGVIEDEPYWSECLALIFAMPARVKVFFHGPVKPSQSNVALARHGLLFLPTRGENYGHVIAEALSAGRPVLLSDQTPWSDVVEAGAGWVLPLGDADAFANVVSRFVSMGRGDYVQMSAAAVAYARKNLCRPEDVADNRRLFRRDAPGTRNSDVV